MNNYHRKIEENRVAPFNLPITPVARHVKTDKQCLVAFKVFNSIKRNPSGKLVRYTDDTLNRLQWNSIRSSRH